MCDYCEKGRKLIDILSEEYGYSDSDCTMIDGDILHLEAETACGEDNVGIEKDYKINYCFMCGRELTNVEKTKL